MKNNKWRDDYERCHSRYLSFGRFSVIEPSHGEAQFSEAGVEKLKVAVDAPDFTLKELGGGVISLKDLRGKFILLNFFATW